MFDPGYFGQSCVSSIRFYFLDCKLSGGRTRTCEMVSARLPQSHMVLGVSRGLLDAAVRNETVGRPVMRVKQDPPRVQLEDMTKSISRGGMPASSRLGDLGG